MLDKANLLPINMNMYMKRCRPLRPKFYDGSKLNTKPSDDDEHGGVYAWMMATTDNAIRRTLKKTLKIATQTNGWFFPPGRGMQTHQNPCFSTQEEVSLALQDPGTTVFQYDNDEEDF